MSAKDVKPALFDIEMYRTDVEKEREGVVCYISAAAEDGPGIRVRRIPNPDYAELERELSVRYQKELSSNDPEIVRNRLCQNMVELMCHTVITETVGFCNPEDKEQEWDYTPEGGIELFSQSGYEGLLDIVRNFALSSTNYRYEAPTKEDAQAAAETVKMSSSSGKTTRKSK